MAFNFPVAPSVGDTYTGPNSVIYQWDGTKWLGNYETISSASSTTPGVVQLAVASEHPSVADDEATTPAYVNSAVVSGIQQMTDVFGNT